ncbi:hypothetical protein [Rhodococcus opacus]|uniref:Scaffolding protein n=1 Tax=Rhodococcus opacus TaxID=37919 RepID=A0A2S8JAX7_RHOOP|nr:hypothetical protein [Rhodococcus opacus]PQP24157.1 hypothetical protein C5613_14855 [Rhodococcus opacus]
MSDDITTQETGTEQQDVDAVSTTDDQTDHLDDSAQGGDDIEALRSKLDKSVRAEKNLRERLKAAEPLLQQAEAAKEAQKTDLERAQEAANSAAEQVSKLRDRAVRAEAKVLASANFTNPDLAIRLLGDITSYVSDDGDIDTEQISVDLSALLESDPYLGRTQDTREMKPNRAQGRTGGTPLTPGQLARDAEQAGDWKTSGAIKANQLIGLAQNLHPLA